ncbi:ABC transporter permease [Phaeacidiphilus oryzae]|uniref:ABC transporter permease n=1 Tax=Phaeacidiphilus oryzae TaxID=348818 RepID=UPI00056641FF|nr:FtsX family ABC transporter permease [Phaeacidiphilus oryzae]
MIRTALRNLFAHKGRVALSLIAVAISVAFVSGTLIFTGTVNATFDRLFTATSADVTVHPKQAAAGSAASRTTDGGQSLLPAALVRRIAGAPGVAAAHGEVSTTRLSVTDTRGNRIGPTGGAPTIGSDWDPSRRQPAALTSGRAPSGAGQVLVDSDTVAAHHLVIGDRLVAVTPYGSFPETVTGIVTFTTANPGAGLFVFDGAAAQRQLLGRPGVYNDIAVDAAAGHSDQQVRDAVERAIGGGYTVRTRAQETADQQSQIGSSLGVLRGAMLGFAGIAVLAGVFLIFNTFSMLVAQRTRQLGLLRAIGADRRQTRRGVLAEALLLGAAGSALGVGAGIGLSVGLIRLMRASGMNLTLDQLSIGWTAPVAGCAVGVLATLAAGWIPARRAGRVSPVEAMRSGGGEPAGRHSTRRAAVVRACLGLLTTGAGGYALAQAALAERGGTGAALLALGVAASLIGVVVLAPVLAALVMRALGRLLTAPAGAAGRLAQRNVLRNPRRTGATAAALMVGLALVTGMSVAGNSMVASAGAAIDRSVGADYVVHSDGGLPITPAMVSAARRTPGLGHLTEQREIGAVLRTPDGAGAGHAYTVEASDPSFTQDFRVATDSGDATAVYRPGGGIVVPRSFAAAHHLTVGESVTASFDGARRTAVLPVGAIASDTGALYKGAFYVSTATLERYVPADRLPADDMLLAAAAKGADRGTVYSALKAAERSYPQLTVADQADYKRNLRQQISSLLDLVYGLLALAIVVAVLGVVNTLALSAVERGREIGMLRAVGAARRQVRRMFRLEAVAISVFGALLGVGVGLGWGVVAQRLLRLQGLDVLAVPWPTLAAVLAGSAAVGVLAAVVPAWRAARADPLAALSAE